MLRFPAKRPALGLEITSTALRLAVVSGKGAKASVIGTARAVVPPGMVNESYGAPNLDGSLDLSRLVTECLAGLGRPEEARRRLETTFKALSPLGLLSEDFDPATRRLWGNYPQAYSHVGLIHAAFDASPRWPDVL